MKIDLPVGAGFSELARSLAEKSSEIDDMYLVVPFRVKDKGLETDADDVHVMVVGKDGTEIEIELREQEGKTVARLPTKEPNNGKDDDSLGEIRGQEPNGRHTDPRGA